MQQKSPSGHNHDGQNISTESYNAATEFLFGQHTRARDVHAYVRKIIA